MQKPKPHCALAIVAWCGLVCLLSLPGAAGWNTAFGDLWVGLGLIPALSALLCAQLRRFAG